MRIKLSISIIPNGWGQRTSFQREIVVGWLDVSREPIGILWFIDGGRHDVIIGRRAKGSTRVGG